MVHIVAKWRELLNDFQNAYAKHGEALFALYAVTLEQRGGSFVGGESWAQLGESIGHVMLDSAKGDGYAVVAISPGEGPSPLAAQERQWIAQGFRLDVGYERASIAFRELAAIAGSSLPPQIRDAIPVQPANAVSWWLATMFWSDPSALEKAKNVKFKQGYRLIWSSPFEASIGTIERCLLASREPILPHNPPRESKPASSIHESELPHTDDWLHDASTEPPAVFYSEKWLTGTMTELGYALRPAHLKRVGDRQLLKDFRKRAEGKKSLVWCRATQTDELDVFLHHHEPRNENAILKKLHAAQARLTEYRNAKLTEPNGTQTN